MIKKTVVLIVTAVFVCFGFAKSSYSNPAFEKHNSQHAVAMVLSACYYCEYKKWPRTTGALRRFQRLRKIELRFKPDWRWFRRKAVRYNTSKSYRLVSRLHDKKDGRIVIRSGQRRPRCLPGETTLNGAYVNIGKK